MPQLQPPPLPATPFSYAHGPLIQAGNIKFCFSFQDPWVQRTNNWIKTELALPRHKEEWLLNVIHHPELSPAAFKIRFGAIKERPQNILINPTTIFDKKDTPKERVIIYSELFFCMPP